MKEKQRVTVELATVQEKMRKLGVESAVEGRSGSRWVEMEEVRDE